MTLRQKYQKKYYNGGNLTTTLPMVADTAGDIMTAGGRKASVGGSTLKGAASGAALGTSIMPGWGTAIGAVVGAGAGFVMGKKNQAKEKTMIFNQGLAQKQQQLQRSSAIIGNNPALVTGQPGEEFYASGGFLKSRYYGNIKASGGSLNPMSSDSAEVQGPSHGQGGVDLPQYNSELEGGETIQDDYVFSERLGFAQIHKKLATAIGKIEQKPATPDRINALKAMNNRVEQLKQAQEQIREQLNLQ